MSADPDILSLILVPSGGFWFMTPRILMEPLVFTISLFDHSSFNNVFQLHSLHNIEGSSWVGN